MGVERICPNCDSSVDSDEAGEITINGGLLDPPKETWLVCVGCGVIFHARYSEEPGDE